MAKKDIQYNTESLSGMHIYEDEKGRIIYYQPRKMTGYIIKEENVKTYRTLSNRYIIAILAVLVLYIALGDEGLPIWVCGVIGVGVLLLLEYRFHMVFLPSLAQLQHFIPKEKPGVVAALAQQQSWRLICKALIYPVFGILLLVLFYQRQMQDPNTEQTQTIVTIAFGIIILIFTCIYGFLNLRGYLYRRSHKAELENMQAKSKKKK